MDGVEALKIIIHCTHMYQCIFKIFVQLIWKRTRLKRVCNSLNAHLSCFPHISELSSGWRAEQSVYSWRNVLCNPEKGQQPERRGHNN